MNLLDGKNSSAKCITLKKNGNHKFDIVFLVETDTGDRMHNRATVTYLVNVYIILHFPLLNLFTLKL